MHHHQTSHPLFLLVQGTEDSWCRIKTTLREFKDKLNVLFGQIRDELFSMRTLKVAYLLRTFVLPPGTNDLSAQFDTHGRFGQTCPITIFVAELRIHIWSVFFGITFATVFCPQRGKIYFGLRKSLVDVTVIRFLLWIYGILSLRVSAK